MRCAARCVFVQLRAQAVGTARTHVAYKGSGPAMTDLIGGHIQLMFENVPTAAPFVKLDEGRRRSPQRRASRVGHAVGERSSTGGMEHLTTGEDARPTAA